MGVVRLWTLGMIDRLEGYGLKGKQVRLLA